MLTFNLKKEWFDKIKSGEKTHEYREVKPYWQSRLTVLSLKLIEKNNGFIVDDEELMCEFVCGYAPAYDKDKRIRAIVKNLLRVWGTDTDLKIDKPVYDIEFELI